MYIFIVAALAVSAFLAVTETSLSSHNKIRMKKKAQEGDPRAKSVMHLIEHYDKTLSTLFVADNLLAVGASSMGAMVFTYLFGASGVLVNTITFTFLFLIVEIFPKTLADAKSDEMALGVAGPMRALCVILTPLSIIFMMIQTKMRKWVAKEDVPSITGEELLHFIETIEEEGVLDEQESSLLQTVLELDETSLWEIITPRVNLEALDVGSTQEEIAAFLQNTQYSRVPVYEESVDNIIGILFVQKAMSRLITEKEVTLRDIIEAPYYVHEGMKLSGLISAFQTKEVHMAVVLDEYGGTAGIATPVDILEELVGKPEELTPEEDGSYEISGDYYMWDMFDELNIDEKDVESDYSTVNGWAMSHIGFIPEAGESFVFGDYRFTVLEMDGNKIARLKAEVIDQKSESIDP